MNGVERVLGVDEEPRCRRPSGVRNGVQSNRVPEVGAMGLNDTPAG